MTRTQPHQQQWEVKVSKVDAVPVQRTRLADDSFELDFTERESVELVAPRLQVLLELLHGRGFKDTDSKGLPCRVDLEPEPWEPLVQRRAFQRRHFFDLPAIRPCGGRAERHQGEHAPRLFVGKLINPKNFFEPCHFLKSEAGKGFRGDTKELLKWNFGFWKHTTKTKN